MVPVNKLHDVRRLATDEDTCEFFNAVLEELPRHGLDTDDLREIIRTELSESHCFRTRLTEKYHRGTTSDCYSVWIEDCASYMFLKVLIANPGSSGERLVVTSFKKDDRHDD